MEAKLMSHPTVNLHDDVHQRVRLGILAILTGASKADFRYLREALGVTDGNLGRHLLVLEDAGLVTKEKVFRGKRPQTWIAGTKEGRAAFRSEVAALKALVDESTDSAERPASELPIREGGSAPASG
jgi:DNA-binding transcriptional ArsR family regulator